MEPRCLLAAGALDTTFGTGGEGVINFDAGGGSRDEGKAVAIQSDGKILVAGKVARSGVYNTTNYDFGVARFNANGTVDTSFGTRGKTIAFDIGGDVKDEATGIAVQSDGKIVIVGSARISNTETNFAIARLNSNGSLDTTFSGDGKQTVSFGSGIFADATCVAIQSNGKIVVAGSAGSTQSDFAVARLNSNGSLDTTFSGDGLQKVPFNLGGTLADVCRTVALQTDGKIVLAGGSFVGTTNVDFSVARLTATGALDTTFDGDGKKTIGFDLGGDKVDQCYAMTISSGKILLAGSAQYSGGDHDFAVARLNTNGSLDTSFNANGKRTFGFDIAGTKTDVANGIRVQSDGKIVVAGWAQTSSGGDYAVARLTTSGSLDGVFGSGGKKTSGRTGDDKAFGLAIQSNGRIVIAGYSNINGTYDFAVARLLNS